MDNIFLDPKLSMDASRYFSKVMARVSVMLVYLGCVCTGSDMHLNDFDRVFALIANLEVFYKEIYWLDLCEDKFEVAKDPVRMKISIAFLLAEYYGKGSGLGVWLAAAEVTREECLNTPGIAAKKLYQTMFKPILDKAEQERNAKLN